MSLINREFDRSLVGEFAPYDEQKHLQYMQKEPNFKNETAKIKRCFGYSETSPDDTELPNYIQLKKSIDVERFSKDNLLTCCRVCLASCNSSMLFLFDAENENQRGREEASLIDKLNYCSCFATKASVDDQLPQYICTSCSILIENAYELKMLCEKTEERIRQLDHPFYLCDIKMDIDENTDNIEEDAVPVAEECIPTVELKSDPNLLETKKEVQIVDINAIRIQKNFQCDICGDEFSHKQSVRSHIMAKHVHKGKKPFQCTECGKCYRLKFSLKTHMLCHSGERPFVCEVCGKSFRACGTLSRHRIVHTDSKDFKCSICAFITNTKANLNIHERIHSEVLRYACQHCPMKFRTSSNAAKHTRNVHEKQKPYKCDVCDRVFFNRQSQRAHSITHTGLKPFYCVQEGCLSMYAMYKSLKKHVRNQHSNENVKIPREKFFFDKLNGILS
ncbi:zinc finger protein 16-like [Contarinia nasturtii]|uniref:zinc finger protein 16-like n=1 Tax=Contarinia nasturtii TaxID=265458 RepID=UPI0012D44AC6|nr:zinc finger protein 16-like [Contarinia nasturtii]